MQPPAAAALVLTNIRATALDSATSDKTSSDPPLNPNHPNQSKNVPRVASGKFAPGIGLISPSGPYFPVLGPRRSTPARAATAPAM